jgi:hypothetical protein
MVIQYPTRPTGFDEAWKLLRTLSGKTLFTLAQAKPFKVLRVDSDSITIRPLEGRTEISISKHALESTRQALETKRQLRQTELEGFTPRRTAYTSTIVATLPEVVAKTGPVTLYWRGEEKTLQK